jgi:hypothetical protein
MMPLPYACGARGMRHTVGCEAQTDLDDCLRHSSRPGELISGALMLGFCGLPRRPVAPWVARDVSRRAAGGSRGGAV